MNKTKSLLALSLFVILSLSFPSTLTFITKSYELVNPWFNVPAIRYDLKDSNDVSLVATATGQIDNTPILTDRGKDYETYQIGNTGQNKAVLGVPAWVLDTSTGQYIPIKITETSVVIVVQSGLIAVNFNKITGDVSYYKPEFNDFTNTVAETWKLFNIGSEVTKTFQSINLVQNGNNANVTQTWSTSKGIVTVNYIFREGLPLKHEVTLAATSSGTYTITQEWSLKLDQYELRNGTKVNVSALPDGSITLSKAIVGDALKRLHFNKAGSLVVGELLDSAWDNFISLKLTKSGTTITLDYNYGTWANSFTLDPDTFTNSSPSTKRDINTTSQTGSTCTTTASSSFDGDMVAFVFDSATSGWCLRNFQEWSTSGITDGSTITDVDITYRIDDINNPRNCDWKPMVQNGSAPSTLTAQQQYDEIGDGTAYVSNDSGCTTTGTGKIIDLGSSADTDLQNKLSADWFAVGVKANSETRDSVIHCANSRAGSAACEGGSGGSMASWTLDVTYTPPSVTQPITITVADSGTGGTATLSGCSVNPTTISMDGSSHNFTANPSCTITITVPSDGANTRHRFASESTTTTVVTCSSGTCSGASKTVYYQYQNNWSLTINLGGSPTIQLTCNKTGTSTPTSLSSGTNNVWCDHNSSWSVPDPVSGGANERWDTSSTVSGTVTSGGSTFTLTYYHQYQNNFKYTVLLGGSPTAPDLTYHALGSTLTLTLTGVDQALYTDADSVSVPATIAGAVDERWKAASSSQTISSGGNNYNFNYYHQYNYTVGFIVVAGGNAIGVSNTITVTCKDVGSNQVVTFNSGTSGNDLNYRDNDTCTWIVESTGSTSSERWRTQDTLTGTPSAGGSKSNTYYNQLSLNLQTGGSPSPQPTITFTSFGSSSAPSLSGSQQTFWADRASSYTIEATITVSSTERFHTYDNTSATVSTTETRTLSYSHEFNFTDFRTSTTFKTQNSKVLRNKPSYISLVMPNNTTFNEPISGWLGQVDSVNIVTLTFYTWNGINKTNDSTFTIASLTPTIAVQGIVADSANSIQLAVQDDVTSGTVTYDSSTGHFSWTSTGVTASGNHDLVVDEVGVDFQVEPNNINVNGTVFDSDSVRWTYDSGSKIFSFLNVEFSGNNFVLNFGTTTVTVNIYDEFHQPEFLPSEYQVRFFTSVNTTTVLLPDDCGTLVTCNNNNATITDFELPGMLQEVDIIWHPNMTEQYGRQQLNEDEDSAPTFNFYFANNTKVLYPVTAYGIVVQDYSVTLTEPILRIKKAGDNGVPVIISEGEPTFQNRVEVYLVPQEKYILEVEGANGEIRNLGEWEASVFASSSNFVIRDLQIVGEISTYQDSITIAAWHNDTRIYYSYEDSLATTDKLQVWLEGSDGTVLLLDEFTTTNELAAQYNTADPDVDYNVRFVVRHSLFGDFEVAVAASTNPRPGDITMQGLVFDGSSYYLDRGDNSTLDIDNLDFTIRVRLSAGTNAGLGTVLSKGSVSLGYLMQYNSDGTITLYVNGNDINTMSVIDDSAVHDILVTHNDTANNLKLYVDGIQEDDVPYTDPSSPTADGFSFIVGANSAGGQIFNGTLYRVDVWNQESTSVAPLGLFMNTIQAKQVPNLILSLELTRPNVISEASLWFTDDATGDVNTEVKGTNQTLTFTSGIATFLPKPQIMEEWFLKLRLLYIPVSIWILLAVGLLFTKFDIPEFGMGAFAIVAVFMWYNGLLVGLDNTEKVDLVVPFVAVGGFVIMFLHKRARSPPVI